MSPKPTLTIGFVQYSTAQRLYLPYSVGLLQASLQGRARQPARYRFLLPRVEPLAVAVEAAALAEADVAAFSLYTWNERRSLAVAARLKQDRPEVLIVCGGPQVPDAAEAWLRKHPQIDVCCHGEGEDVFLELIESHPERSWEQIPGLSWIDATGFHHTPPRPRRRELDVFPSPFLTGVFDPLLATGREWACTWETNRGCPFTCVFCDWGSATATRVNRFGDARLQAELAWFGLHKIAYVFCADANFGILARDAGLAATAAEIKRRTGFPGALVVQNAKNLSERSFEIQCQMSAAGLDPQITISLQSLHPPALKASGRENISLAAFERLQQRLQARGVHTYTDLILGLPEETYDSFADGLATLISRGQYHAIQFFCANILPNAPMAQADFRLKHRLETVEMPHHAFHAPIQADADGLVETIETVVATATLSRADWKRMRILAWMTELLFYKPGTVRLPLLLLHAEGGLGIRALLEAFMTPAPTLPALGWVCRFLEQKAEEMLAGKGEYCPGLEPDGRLYWWSPAEAALDWLTRNRQLEAYAAEASALLHQLAGDAALPAGALADALFLSHNMLRLQARLEPRPAAYTAGWNVWDWYQGRLASQDVPLAPAPALYYKDWTGAPYRFSCRRTSPARPRPLPAAPAPGARADLRAAPAPGESDR